MAKDFSIFICLYGNCCLISNLTEICFQGSNKNNPPLVEIMAWHQIGKNILPKCICPTCSFTCLGQSSSGKYWALLVFNFNDSVFVSERKYKCKKNLGTENIPNQCHLLQWDTTCTHNNCELIDKTLLKDFGNHTLKITATSFPMTTELNVTGGLIIICCLLMPCPL